MINPIQKLKGFGCRVNATTHFSLLEQYWRRIRDKLNWIVYAISKSASYAGPYYLEAFYLPITEALNLRVLCFFFAFYYVAVASNKGYNL